MSTIIYIPLTADLELKLEITAREYNGIASDPRVRERQPTLSELSAAALTLQNFRHFTLAPSLDFPPA